MKLGHLPITLDALDVIDTYTTVTILKIIVTRSSFLEPPPWSVDDAAFTDILCLTVEKQCVPGAKDSDILLKTAPTLDEHFWIWDLRS